MENILRVYVTQSEEILLNELVLSNILSPSQIEYLRGIFKVYVTLCLAAGESPNYNGTAHPEYVDEKHANKVELLSLLWAIHGGKLPLIEISKGEGPLKKIYIRVDLKESTCHAFQDEGFLCRLPLLKEGDKWLAKFVKALQTHYAKHSGFKADGVHLEPSEDGFYSLYDGTIETSWNGVSAVKTQLINRIKAVDLFPFMPEEIEVVVFV